MTLSPRAEISDHVEAVFAAQTVMRIAISITMLTMAAHHLFTWSFFNSLIHDRFDPVFGYFIGSAAGHAFVSAYTRLQTATELLVSIPLLASIGVRSEERRVGKECRL